MAKEGGNKNPLTYDSCMGQTSANCKRFCAIKFCEFSKSFNNDNFKDKSQFSMQKIDWYILYKCIFIQKFKITKNCLKLISAYYSLILNFLRSKIFLKNGLIRESFSKWSTCFFKRKSYLYPFLLFQVTCYLSQLAVISKISQAIANDNLKDFLNLSCQKDTVNDEKEPTFEVQTKR